jgi:molybdopterin-biosynthesis enzyme MoeA-like protein
MMPHFYSVIIGTELLNGRRVDKHFTFLNTELLKRGLVHVSNFVINDNPQIMQNCFNTILADPQSIMFCFGGLGATPDDLTRQIASDVFTAQPLALHVEAKELIEMQFGKEAYPHRITMAYLPPNATLLPNVVNNVPGFQLFNRFFFTPGFPSMAWPMITNVLDTYFPTQTKPFNVTFKIESSENDLIDIMQALPKELEFSCLPRFEGEKRSVEIYLAHPDDNTLKLWTDFFKREALLKGKIIRDC